MTATRRLAAILAADVAGYSRLMGLDGEGTLERLKAHRRELMASTSQHGSAILAMLAGKVISGATPCGLCWSRRDEAPLGTRRAYIECLPRVSAHDNPCVPR